ncbi:MAG TPA: hypothetical protein VKZ72_11835 [Acidimicrobiales bacterium]|nr:hypothetical protein [Acidimicrobiales bacterium]
MRDRIRHAVTGGRRRVVGALLGVLVAGGLWAVVAPPAAAAHPTRPGSPAQPVEVECPNPDGILADLAALLDNLPFVDTSDWKAGGTHTRTWSPPDDLPEDVRDWLRTEIVEHRECSLIDATVLERCPDVPVDDGSVLLPGNCVGVFPTTSYDLTFKRSRWNDMNKLPDLLGYIMIFCFDLATLVVGGAIWLIGFALDWEVAGGVEVAAGIADGINDNLVEELHLNRIAWLVLVAWVAFAVLRGKTAAGVSELALSLVLAMLAGVLVADVTDGDGSYVADAAQAMDDMTADVLLAGASIEAPSLWDGERPDDEEEGARPDPGDDYESAIRALQRGLHTAFVDAAYDQLNWGGPVGLTTDVNDRCRDQGACVPDACIEAKEHILHIQDPDPDWAARHMERAGCADLAAFNRKATPERAIAATLNLLGSIVVVVLFCLVAVTLLIAKFTLTLIFAATPVAAVAAIFPGAGRRGAWMWVGSLLQVYVVVVGSAGLLALLLIMVDATFGTVMHVNLVQRWVLVLVVLATMFLLRRRLLTGSRVLAGKFADSLTRLSVHNAGYEGGAVGANLTAPEDLAGRSFATRRTERRGARRSLRNLEIMERTRERGTLNYEQTIPLAGGTTRGAGGGRHRQRPAPRNAPPAPSPQQAKPGGPGRHRGNPAGGKHRAGRGAGRANLVHRPVSTSGRTAGATARGGTASTPPAAPGPGGAAPTPPGPGGAGPAGASSRLTVSMKMRAPRSPLRHPVGAVTDRARLWRDRRELRGIIRSARAGRERWP